MTFAGTLTRFFIVQTLLFLLIVTAAAVMEDMGVGRQWIGYFFIFTTLGMYAVIGLLSRTSDLGEYFVAGRQVPGVYNGMATAADWMSAASFLGVAGTLYYNGFSALALIVGWTGGFVLIALLIAPYLRKFQIYSVGDFLAQRFVGKDDGRAIRIVCVLVTVAVSFVYVVAQIYAVGLITARFAGVEFGIGVFFGLAGILVCSFLGGMRAVTWTQVAQYLVMIIAMLVTLFSLAYVSTLPGPSNPEKSVATMGLTGYLDAKEQDIRTDPAELQVREAYRKEAQRYQLLIDTLPASWAEGYEARRKNLELARYNGASFSEIKEAERVLATYPKNPNEAKRQWRSLREEELQKMRDSSPHFHIDRVSDGQPDPLQVMNFIAIALTLMCGTVALPHIILRFFTTPNASETRWSVVWALGFILLLYLAAPWVATLVKAVVYQQLVGLSFSELPNWIASWGKVSEGLAALQDVNEDGIIQYGEIVLDADVLLLIAPEMAGLPFFLSGLVAVGGLAAALSTADGLLLTIANTASHDVYFKLMDKTATAQKRVTMSKIALLTVALIAAWVTSLKPGNIVYLVGAAFTLAGSALFVPLVAGVFWSRATRRGATWAMAVGFFAAIWLLGVTNPRIAGFFSIPVWELPFSSLGVGIITIPLSALAMVVVSLLGRPSYESVHVVATLRRPEAK